MSEPTYTHTEAIELVKKLALDYNEQTDTPMSIEPLKATNNIDTIKALEVNLEAWFAGKDETLLFRVVWA